MSFVNDFEEVDNFMEVREAAIDYMKQKRNDCFKSFLKEIGFEDTFAYSYSIKNETVTIYTKKPGCWIGLKGKHIPVLRKCLKEVFDGYEIKFQEIYDIVEVK